MERRSGRTRSGARGLVTKMRLLSIDKEQETGSNSAVSCSGLLESCKAQIMDPIT